jgi:membrane-bound lytic murein transglycosylase B
MRQVGTFFLALFVLFNACSTYADEALVQRRDVRQFIDKLVRKDHFDRRQLTAILKEAKFQPQIIESMDKPYEKKTWDVYKALFLTSQRVQAGIEFWRKNQSALELAQKKYGVPAHIIVAIIGVETLYGQHQGNYRVLDALTTLAFNYPKRSEFFTKELGEFLLLCREQHVPADQYMGSYAGAMGKPQFMPSSYRFYAVDFTGNGKRDLMNDDRDVIGSVANYFHMHGWKMNRGVAQPASVSGSRYKALAMNSKMANYAFKHLIADGVKPVSAVVDHSDKAGVIELMTDNGEEYWIAYPNFYVITRYNTSPQYALVVYLLSQQLNNQWASIQNHSSSHG